MQSKLTEDAFATETILVAYKKKKKTDMFSMNRNFKLTNKEIVIENYQFILLDLTLRLLKNLHKYIITSKRKNYYFKSK